jgi:hypothetical protein
MCNKWSQGRSGTKNRYRRAASRHRPPPSKGLHDHRTVNSSPKCPEMVPPVVANESCIFNRIGRGLQCPERLSLAGRHDVFQRLAACDYLLHVSRTYPYMADAPSTPSPLAATIARQDREAWMRIKPDGSLDEIWTKPATSSDLTPQEEQEAEEERSGRKRLKERYARTQRVSAPKPRLW